MFDKQNLPLIPSKSWALQTALGDEESSMVPFWLSLSPGALESLTAVGFVEVLPVLSKLLSGEVETQDIPEDKAEIL